MMAVREIDPAYAAISSDPEYRDQLERVMEENYFAAADICPDFLGFTETYDALSRIIPKAWTVVDLGCGYAFQAYFFRHHAKYIGVDLSWPRDPFPDDDAPLPEGGWPERREELRFTTTNAEFYIQPIKDFIHEHPEIVTAPRTFAVCNFVPPGREDPSGLVRRSFKNCYVFYPEGVAK